MTSEPRITAALDKLDHGGWSLTVAGFAARVMKIAKPRLASSNARPATRPPQAASCQSTSRFGTATYSSVKPAVVSASDTTV